MFAYDDRVAITVAYKTGLRCAVRGKVLIDFLATASEDVDLELEDGHLVLTDSKSVTKLPILSENDFLFIQPEDESELMQIPLDDAWAKALSLAANTVGSDSLRPETTGVTLQIKNNEINLYSTDNKTATHIVLPTRVGGLTINKAIIIPPQACELIARVYKDHSSGLKWASLVLSEKHISVHIHGATDLAMTVKLIEAKPMDFEDVFEKHVESVETFVQIPQELKTVLERALSVQSSELQKIIQFKVRGSTLNYNAKGPYGELNGQLELVEAAGDIDIKLDVILLLRMWEAAKEIGFGESATVLTNQNFKHLIAYIVGDTK